MDLLNRILDEGKTVYGIIPDSNTPCMDNFTNFLKA